MFRLVLLILVVAVAALFLTGRLGSGPFGTVPINQLHTAPTRWEGERVRVSGTVGHRASVLGFGGFTLVDDEGHEVLVIGHGSPAAPGQPMTVEGRFVTAFAVGDISMSAILVGGGD